MSKKYKWEKLLAITIGSGSGSKSIDFGNFEFRWNDLSDLMSIGQRILTFLVSSGAVVAVAMAIFAGYTLITAAGDPDKIQKGQKMLTNSLIGLAVIAIAGVLIYFVLELLGARAT